MYNVYIYMYYIYILYVACHSLSHRDHIYQNCKQLFIYMINWDKSVALAIFPCIFSAGEY